MKKTVTVIIILIIVSSASIVFAEKFNPLVYKNNYQAEINRLKTLPVTDETQNIINILMYYRIKKIATDFNIYEKYLTDEDMAFLNGVDIACFSDKSAKSNLKGHNAEWDKNGWIYDKESQSYTYTVGD